MFFPLLAIAILAAGCSGKNLTSKLILMQHWDNNFEGKFCFDLPAPVIGWEVVMDFDSGVTNLQQWDGDWVEQPSGCQQHFTLVNKNYKGAHDAGQLCVRFMGQTCQGNKDPSGTGTLVDLSHDNMQVPTVAPIKGAQDTKYNYGEVLMKSILFYEAQRSGKLPANNRVPWRGDSALHDQGSNGEDLTGGWYDAGDNVKFNFPMAWSTTVLEWSLLMWPDTYDKSNQMDNMISSIRWPLEYFIKCHTQPNELYVQVGDGGVDHGQWTSPERMTEKRPAFKIDQSNPGSDVAAETAAAMAAGYLIFKTRDPSFANDLLTHAKQLYDFADKYRGIYSNSVNAAAAFYKSSGYEDELGWGAMWLYKATGDKTYLEKAKSHHEAGAAWGFSWDEKTGGVDSLLYEATKDDTYKQDLIDTFTSWMPGGDVPYSPKCMAFRLQWGALRYASNTALIALVAADLGVNPTEYRKWAMTQLHYALGDAGRSYVVGFGTNPPQRPHHRGSSCPMMPAPCGWEAQQNPGPNPHVLYGALVGGPGQSDDYQDSRLDYVKNEVACDYNAGFQSAIAGLEHLAIAHELPTTYTDVCPHS